MTTVKGTLNVDQAVTLDSTLDVTGDTSVSTFDSTGATSLATGGGVVNIASTGIMTTVKGTLNVDEAVTLDSTLDVTGDTSVTTFDSTGATSLATSGGVVNIASAGIMTTVKGKLNVDEAVTLDSTLDVTGDTSVTTFDSTGATSLATNGGAVNIASSGVMTTIKGELTVNNVSYAHVPSGVIVMWSGSINDIPLGWVLCDGLNGTPNLSGKFIVGYSTSDSDYNNVNNSGGNKEFTITLDNLPQHDHGATVHQSQSHIHGIQGGSHTHPASSDQKGGHIHNINELKVSVGKYGGANGGSYNSVLIDDQPGTDSTWQSSSHTNKEWFISGTVDQNGTHDHTITVDSTSHSHTIQQDGIHSHNIEIHQGGGLVSPSSIDNRPPYYVLCYIIKT